MTMSKSSTRQHRIPLNLERRESRRRNVRLDSIDRGVRKRAHGTRDETQYHRLPGRQLDVLVLRLILDRQPLELLVGRKVYTYR